MPVREFTGALDDVPVAQPYSGDTDQERAKSPSLLDYAKEALTGYVGDTARGLGWVAEKAGIDYGTSMRKSGDWLEEELLQSMTPGGRRAATTPMFTGDGLTDLGVTDKWGQSLAMGGVRSLPQMALMAPLGAPIAAGVSKVIPAAAQAAPGLTGLVARNLPGGLGFGLAEGLQAGATNAAQTQSEIEGTDSTKLAATSPRFRELLASNDPETAKRLLAEEASGQVFRRTVPWTGGVSLLTGGGAMGELVKPGAKSILKGVARGALEEAAQETPQSGGEQYIQNVAKRDYVDQATDPWKEVVSQALTGGAIGGVTGGAFGGSAHVGGRRDVEEETSDVMRNMRELTREMKAQDARKTAETVATDVKARAAAVGVQPADSGKRPPPPPPAGPRRMFDDKAEADTEAARINASATNPDFAGALVVPADQMKFPGRWVIEAKPKGAKDDAAIVNATADAAGPQEAAEAASTAAIEKADAAVVGPVLTGPVETIDDAAHEAASSPANDRPAPSTAQIEANNAKLGHPKVADLDISIENPAGSTRTDKQNEPPKWQVEMKDHYGYIRGTEAFDSTEKKKQGVDVFVKPGTPTNWEGDVFVVNQAKDDGRFDEHKVMLGYQTPEAARAAYITNYDDPAKAEKRIGSIVPMASTQFKTWAFDKTTKGPRGGELKAPVAEAATTVPNWSTIVPNLSTEVLPVPGTQQPIVGSPEAGTKPPKPGRLSPAERRVLAAAKVAEAQITVPEDKHEILRTMAANSGHLERGGQVMRELSATQTGGEVTGVTSWIGQPEWAKGLGANTAEVKTAVEKAIAGKPLGKKQKDIVKAMLAEVQATRANLEESLAEEGIPTDAETVAIAKMVDKAEALEPGIAERLAMQHDTDEAYMAALVQFIKERENATVRQVEEDHRLGEEAARPGPAEPTAEVAEAGTEPKAGTTSAVASSAAPATPPSRELEVKQRLFVRAAGQTYPVGSFQEASEKWEGVSMGLMRAGNSASDTPTPIIVDQDGKAVGYISWNGRVWPGSPQDDSPDKKPLYSRPGWEKFKGLKEAPSRAGEEWDDAEDKRLLKGLDDGKTVVDLAIDHQRTENGIRARMERLGRGATAVAAPAARPALNLKGETEAEIQRKAAEKTRAEEEKRRREAAPSPGDFTLTGSSRPADEAAARGQKDLLAAPTNPMVAAADALIEAANAMKAAVSPAAEKPASSEKSAPTAGGELSAEQEKARYEVAPRLSVLHNLNAGNLKFADRMGGLAVPSLGVVPDGMGISGMGDITLIGRKELADPAVEPVHDADVYSPTFPRAEYDKVRSATAEKLHAEIKPFTTKFDDYNANQVTLDNAVNNPDPQKIIQTWLNGRAAKAMFLAERGTAVDPVMVTKKVQFPWVKYVDWEEFRKVIPFNDERDMDTRERSLTDVKPIILKAIDAYIERDSQGKKLLKFNEGKLDETRANLAHSFGVSGDWIIDAGGAMPYALQWKIYESREGLGKKEVDGQETEKRLNAALTGREAEFKQWVDDKVMGIFGYPFLRVRGKKEPYTLGNIVEMMSGRVKATQDTMTYGEGKARAAAAKKFSDLEQMRRAAGSIADESTISASREEAKKLIEAYRNSVVPYYGDRPAGGDRGFGRVWEGLDASMKAMARWAKGAKTEDNMKRALAREGFRTSSMPSFAFEDAVTAGMAWLKAPVPYFEAKPQRAVMLKEFAGAVIPDKTDDATKAILDKHGIPYQTYKSGGPNDRNAQQQATDKFRRELAASGENVLFQPKAAYTTSPWYSELSRKLTDLKRDTGTAAEWKAIIAQLPGVKRDEIEWSGVNEWLDMWAAKDRVPKDVVLDFLNKNGVRVEETLLGENTPDEAKATSEKDRLVVELDSLGYTIETEPDTHTNEYVFSGLERRSDRQSFNFVPGEGFELNSADGVGSDLPERVQEIGRRLSELEHDLPNAEGTTARYSQYTLPGGPLSRDTEILTADGWLRMDAIRVGDTVLTRNDDDGKLEWQGVEAVPTVFAPQLYHFFNHSMNMLVTKDHQMVVKRRRRSPHGMMRVTAEKLWSMSECVVPLTGDWRDGKDGPLFGLDAGDVAEFIGWYLSEGSYKHRNGHKNTIQIAQCDKTNPAKCARLKALFDRLGFKSKYYGGSFGVGVRSMPRDLVELLHAQPTSEGKYIPSVFFQMKKGIVARLLEAMVLGDGCTTPAKGRRTAHSYYFTKSARLAGDVQAMVLLTGKHARVRRRKTGLYAVSIADREWGSVDDAKHAITTYNDTAYCVTVKNHAIYVRRNGVAAFTGNSNYRELLLTLNSHEGNEFRSSHFNEPNILAHLRFNERTDAEGKKVLFIEEFQSDWAQRGKREGFKTGAEERFNALKAEVEKKHGQSLVDLRPLRGPQRSDEIHADLTRIDEAYQEAQREKHGSEVPAAPFVGKTEAWLGLALKRMIAYATEHGFERVAWTTGEQQADRYSLDKYVDKVVLVKTAQGAEILRAYNKGSQVINETIKGDKTVADHIGKEAAARLDRMEWDDGGGTLNKEKVLRGLDLKIGGEGMRAFYDKIVPNVANDVLKKLGGGRVGNGTITYNDESGTDTPEKKRARWWIEVDGKEYNAYSGLTTANEDMADLREAGKKPILHDRGPGPMVTLDQLGFDITPALRDRAMGGLALFQTKQAYNPDQLGLAYENAQTRPGTTEEQKSLGIAALKSLFGRDRRAGATVLGSALWKDFTEHQGSELIGQQVESAEDLAVLAQILRDPRFETLRFFFTKGDEVVGHTGVTSRLPGAVAFATSEEFRQAVQRGAPESESVAAGRKASDARLAELAGVMQAIGADGYWVLHNHPSGSSIPSKADISITKHFDAGLKGFRGHVIIDQDEYSIIDGGGDTMHRMMRRGSPNGEPELRHDALSRTIDSPGALAQVAATLKAKQGFAVMVSTSSRGKVMAIAEIPEAALSGATPSFRVRAMARVRRFARMTGSPNGVFIVAKNPAALDFLIHNSLATDITGFRDPQDPFARPEISRASLGVVQTADLTPKTGVLRAEQMKWGATAEREASPRRSTPWPADADHIVSTSVLTTAMKAHKDYTAAKAGDRAAADRLVQDLFRPANLREVRQRIGADAYFVPVIAKEATGDNAIPVALAEWIAFALNTNTVEDVVQANQPHHTGAKAMERLIARPVFDGKVEAGRKYALVDDVTLLGGTLSELADHIQKQGGVVAGAVVLVNASRSATMLPSRAQVNDIERRYGDEVRELFGIEPAALNRAEATYVLGFRDAQSLRARAAAAKDETRQRLESRALRQDGAPEAGGLGPRASRRPVTDTPEFRAWFGNSKVVDANGKPLRVYHGTAKGGFAKFKTSTTGLLGRGAYFTSDATDAEDYGNADPTKGSDATSIYPVYLSMQQPFMAGVNDGWANVFEELTGRSPRNWDNEMPNERQLRDLKLALVNNGYDGIIIDYSEPLGAAGPVTHYVVLDPKQVKSSIGNRGTFDPSDANILKQPQAPYDQDDLFTTPEERKAGPDPFTIEGREKLADRAKDWLSSHLQTDRTFNWWHRTVGTQYHKATVSAPFRRAFVEGQEFLTDTNFFSMRSEEQAPDILLRIEDVKDLAKRPPPKADIEGVGRALYAGTLAGGASPLKGKVWTDADLKKQGLTDKQMSLYHQTRAAIDNSVETLAKSVIARLLRSYDMRIQRDQSLTDVAATAVEQLNERRAELQLEIESTQDTKERHRISQEMDAADTAREQVEKTATRAKNLIAAGYMPLMRFGRYTVNVFEMDIDGKPVEKYFGMYESQPEANRAAQALAKEFPDASVQKGILSKDAYRIFKGISPDTIELFADVAGLDEHPLLQQYIQLAVSERSALKRLLERKGVPGYSWDVPRVLAQFITSNARAASGNYHHANMLQAVDEIPQGQGDVKDEAVRLYEYLTNPQEEAPGLRGYLFFHFMGGSIATAMVNMTQPVMMTGPWLAQHTNPAKAAKELGQAMLEAVKHKPPTDAAGTAMLRAMEEGIVAPHEIYQLMAEARGGIGRSVALRQITRAWGGLFSLAEAWNRKTTFLAAYRIAEDAKMTDPYAFAVKAVVETQGLYNRGNRPNWARGPIGATVFTFKQYSIAYLEFLKRLPGPQRAMALAILAFAAGLQGLPGADDLDDLVDTFGQWMGFATNTKQWKRKTAEGLLGQEVGQFVLHGLSAIPRMPLDVQMRLGLGNLIPGTSMFKPSDGSDKGREIAEVLGPVGGLAKASFDVAREAFQGDAAGAAKAGLPSALKNGYQALEMWQTGEYRDTRDRRVIDTTALDGFVKAVGFNPSAVARASRRIGETITDVNLQKTTESSIADQWARAITDKDQDGIKAARERLLEWNKTNPELPVRIENSQLMRRVRELRRTREERFLRRAAPEIRGQVAKEMRE